MMRIRAPKARAYRLRMATSFGIQITVLDLADPPMGHPVG
jgi:hypothetical protein